MWSRLPNLVFTTTHWSTGRIPKLTRWGNVSLERLSHCLVVGVPYTPTLFVNNSVCWAELYLLCGIHHLLRHPFLVSSSAGEKKASLSQLRENGIFLVTTQVMAEFKGNLGALCPQMYQLFFTSGRLSLCLVEVRQEKKCSWRKSETQPSNETTTEELALNSSTVMAGVGIYNL